VIPLVLIASGVVALLLGIVTLRSLGEKYRVGRLLAAAPTVTIGQARELALGGPNRIVRVDGRIDSETEFEDAHHRPLVFRRTRVELVDGRGWRAVEDSREAVDFDLREDLDSIAIDHEALGDGLVVVPRESAGVAGDIPDRVPAGTPRETPARVRIDQVSSVEHAIAVGVPVVGPDGEPRLTAGMGRPLVLTTLEPAEAMRLLAAGHSRRPLIATILGAAGLVLVSLGLVAGAAQTLA
jgi:hypothetical protein